ncbi:cytochrome-c peroxidase [Persephonella sp.]
MLVSFIVAAGVTISCNTEEQTLLDEARRYFSPLPVVFDSRINPVTPEKVWLGKMLFYERRLSINGTISCARCHPIEYYGTDRLKISEGLNCHEDLRNAPTVLNAAGQRAFNWTGDRPTVEEHAKKALLGKVSTGITSFRWIENRLKSIPGYVELFKKAFPGDKDPVRFENVVLALGAFERALVTPSRFDMYLKGDIDALSEEEKTGLRLFIEKGCASCHTGTLLGGTIFRKFGIVEPYWKYTGSKKIDEGRYSYTSDPQDRFVFKVPQLRNVAKTPPYFHDGSVKTLKEAIRIMGKVQLGIDLSVDEINSIEAFLQSLTGNIPQDMLTVPVLP